MADPEPPEQAAPEDVKDAPGRSHMELLLQYRWWAFAVISVVCLMAWGVAEGFTVPRWLKIAGLAAVASLPLGAPVASRIVAWLYDPGYVYLVDLDPSGSDEFAVWELPPARWRELELVDGMLHQLPSKATAYEVESYDKEANAAVGTWRGSASDRELLEFEAKVDEVRGDLLDRAHEAFVLKVTRAGRYRAALDRIMQAFVQDFEAEGLYRGEAVQEAADKAVKDAGLEPRSERAQSGVKDDGSEAALNIEFNYPNSNGDGEGDVTDLEPTAVGD